jgi:hypothetical protein
MTLQSTFDLDIFVRITTSSSQTIINARGLEEIFSLLQYSILALIASFLACIGDGLDRMIDWLIEPVAWLRIGLFFSFSASKELCRGLIQIVTD